MTHPREGVLIATLLVLGACGGRGSGPPAPVAAAAQDPPPGARAIMPPGEDDQPAATPSYEVAIASAAADHNKALERCKQQPEAVRVQCEQEANAAFADAGQDLQDLRGNQH